MKSKLLLLDANVVIEAHRQGLWKTLYTQYEIYLPATVLNQEAQFFVSKSTFEQTTISLKPHLDSGEIFEIFATVEEVESLSKKITESFFLVLGDGEIEALAILHSEKIEGIKFSTADGPAIQAMGALNMSYSGASFEELLVQVGQGGKVSQLAHHYRKKFYDDNIARGKRDERLILK